MIQFTDLASALYRVPGPSKMPPKWLVGAHLRSGNNLTAVYVPYCGRPNSVFKAPLDGPVTPGLPLLSKPGNNLYWCRAQRSSCGFEADFTLEQDAQLVQQCLQGDGSAWEELVRRHSRRIFNICYRFTGNRTEAEDLSQDVFLRVYRTLSSYRSVHGGFATWMTSVTRNLLIDHYRRTKRDRITDSLDDAMPVVENKQSSARRPDEQALLGELNSQVQSALAQLSPELREAVILRDLQQLEYSEIQTVLSVPEGTVKSRINRGRIELARVLQQMGVRPS
jgi:RNA polymerase sigma-70 factor (ECF subfamily)